jgi:hypothetical protein
MRAFYFCSFSLSPSKMTQAVSPLLTFFMLNGRSRIHIWVPGIRALFFGAFRMENKNIYARTASSRTALIIRNRLRSAPSMIVWPLRDSQPAYNLGGGSFFI